GSKRGRRISSTVDRQSYACPADVHGAGRRRWKCQQEWQPRSRFVKRRKQIRATASTQSTIRSYKRDNDVFSNSKKHVNENAERCATADCFTTLRNGKGRH